jgi:hypothetical protein
MDFSASVSTLECSTQSFDEISADNVLKSLWLGPVIKAENFAIEPSAGLDKNSDRKDRGSTD